MMLTSGLWNLAGELVWPFWSLYVLHLGGSYFDVGFISALGSIFGVLPFLLGGYLADALGRKRMVYALSFSLSSTALINAFAPDWRWLIASSVLSSVSSGLRQPAFGALIADSTREEDRAEAYALFSIVPPLFGVASPYVMGLYIDRVGVVRALRLGYLILFTFSFTASLLRLLLLKETLPREMRREVKASTILRDSFRGMGETVGIIPRELWALIAVGFSLSLGAAIGTPFWVTYATEDVIGLSKAEWGLVSTLVRVVALALTFPFALAADRWGRVKLVLSSLLLHPWIVLTFIYSRGFWMVALVSVAGAVASSMSMAASQALFVDYSPREHRGRINALLGVLGITQSFTPWVPPGSILGAVGGLLGGVLYGRCFQLPLYLQASSTALAALTALLSLRGKADKGWRAIIDR
jgi:MFS family permease